MSANVNQRAKARRAGKPAWMVGEPIFGVGNPSTGPLRNYMITRTPLGKYVTGNNVHHNPCTNQLSGTGRYRSQFSVTADGIDPHKCDNKDK